jgi:ATP-dependent Clp protease ATP-binding subunit ClpA
MLLGLVKEGSGVGANVLRNLDVDVKKLRIEIDKRIQRGPDKVAPGKLPQTDYAKGVIESAINEARLKNHSYVGTEHILLGLLQVKDGLACQILNSLNVTYEKALEEVLRLLGDETLTEDRQLANSSQDMEKREQTPYEESINRFKSASVKYSSTNSYLETEQLDNIKKQNEIIDDIFREDQNPVAQRMKLANFLIHNPNLLSLDDASKIILDYLNKKND